MASKIWFTGDWGLCSFPATESKKIRKLIVRLIKEVCNRAMTYQLGSLEPIELLDWPMESSLSSTMSRDIVEPGPNSIGQLRSSLN